MVAKAAKRHSHQAPFVSTRSLVFPWGTVTLTVKNFDVLNATVAERQWIDDLATLLDRAPGATEIEVAAALSKISIDKNGIATLKGVAPEPEVALPVVSPAAQVVGDPEFPPGSHPISARPFSGTFSGEIKNLDLVKRFGFIRNSFGEDVFSHEKQLEGLVFDLLVVGDKVRFELGKSLKEGKSPPAQNVRAVV